MLSPYLDNFLAPNEREEVEEHVKYCEKCANLFIDLKEVSSALKRASRDNAPPDVAENILRAIRKAESETPWWRKIIPPSLFSSQNLIPATSLMAAILIVLGTVWILRRQTGTFSENPPVLEMDRLIEIEQGKGKTDSQNKPDLKDEEHKQLNGRESNVIYVQTENTGLENGESGVALKKEEETKENRPSPVPEKAKSAGEIAKLASAEPAAKRESATGFAPVIESTPMGSAGKKNVTVRIALMSENDNRAGSGNITMSLECPVKEGFKNGLMIEISFVDKNKKCNIITSSSDSGFDKCLCSEIEKSDLSSGRWEINVK